MTREITYCVPDIVLRCWGYCNEEGKNSLCLHIAKSFFGKIELEKEIKMCYGMKEEVQVAMDISGESN